MSRKISIEKNIRGIHAEIFGRKITIPLRRNRETQQLRQGHPVIFVSDFGTNDHAHVECQLITSATFAQRKLAQPEIFNAHHVVPFDIDHGSQVIGQLTKGAREGTVVIGVVDPGVGSDGDKQRRRIILQTNNGITAVGPDNGLFSQLIERDGVAKAWEINAPALDDLRRQIVEQTGLYYNTSTTFDGRDIFAPAAALIAAGEPIEKIGIPIETGSLVKREIPQGKVVDIDPYGDIKVAERIPQGAIGGYLIKEDGTKQWFPLGKTFADVAEGNIVGLRSSNERLEIAVRESNAGRELGIKIGDVLQVEWILEKDK